MTNINESSSYIDLPKNDNDKKLSSAELEAWRRFALQELKEDIAKNLTVSVNWVNKYAKDVIFYNSDLQKISNNPEEVVKVQVYLKSKWQQVDINGNYDKTTTDAIDALRKSDASTEWEAASFQRRFPEFRKLWQEMPSQPGKLEEFKKRAELFHELKQVKSDLSSTTSLVWLWKKLWGTWTKREIENINRLQALLTESKDLKVDLNNLKLKTLIEWMNSPWNYNYLFSTGVDISWSDYLLRLTNKNLLIGELLWDIKVENNEVLSESDRQKLWNMKVFLDTLISKNPSLNMDYKDTIQQIYDYIYKWGANSANTYLIKLLKDKFNNLIVDFSSQSGLASGLRAIWDTNWAGEIFSRELMNKLPKKHFDKWSSYLQNPDILKNADKQYNEALEFLKEDPSWEYYYLTQDKQKRNELKAWFIKMWALDATIKELWVDWLWEVWEIYNDMKWLYGVLNFSDENVKKIDKNKILRTSMRINQLPIRINQIPGKF